MNRFLDKKSFDKKYKTATGGFSLVETTFIILAGSLVLALLLQILNVQIQREKRELTKTKIMVINEQIQEFFSDEQRYPCAARFSDRPDQAQFGTEVLSLNPLILGCDPGVPPIAQMRQANSPGIPPRPVRIGMVPVRTLNLPDDYAFDGWGNRIIYAITIGQSQAGVYQSLNGGVGVVDRNDVSVTTTPNSLDYAIVAPGPNNLGHYAISGQVVGVCAQGNTLEQENCDMDTIFRTAITSTVGNTAQDFDDFIMYPRDATNSANLLPKGTRLPFDRGGITNCPMGWIRDNPQPTGVFLYCKKL